ncbi:MAG: CRISPR-associated endonuclease Cas2 [Parcubacteria group bacterium]
MSNKIFFYKGLRVNAFGLPISNYNKSRIKKSHRKRKFYHVTFHSEFEKNSPKNLIVMYDIPHEKKKERDWFRRQLKNFDYTMIQKSVWVGPSPLPKDFRDYVELIGLRKQLKTFKLARSYLNKNNNL